MSYPEYNIGDEVSVWVRTGPERIRKGEPTHARLWVNHIGEESYRGLTYKVYFLKNVFGELLPRHFHAPSMELIKASNCYLLPPSLVGPMWASWYGPHSNLSIAWRKCPNGHNSMLLKIWEKVAGVTTTFHGDSLSGLAWMGWARKNQDYPITCDEHGKYPSIFGPVLESNN
jgi:hypothetical protein